MKKFFISIFIFSIIVQQVLAYGKEFKNMLVDLEIGRAGEDTYKVNLKTEVPYPDEIKIVKKSDYNYYILLAETYSLVKTTKSQGTIKSIKVDTYPYAEQNFENGFTKVTFNTTRPVEFIVSLSANRASKFPVMDLVRLARLDNLYKENNFDYLNPKYKVAEVALPEKTAQKEAAVVKKETQAPQKVAQATAKQPIAKQAQKSAIVAQKATQSTKVAQEPQKVVQKEVIKPVQKETPKVAPPAKPQTVAKAPQLPKVETKKQEQPQKTVTAQKIASAPKATVKPAEAQKVTTPQKQAQPQSKKVETKQTTEKKQVEKPAPQAPAKVAQAPAKFAFSDVQSPKEMPKVPEITEDKAPDNIELEPIEKIEEEPVPNDFKNTILSFLIGNKISILAGLILLIAISALSKMKKKSSNGLVPVVAPVVEETQTTENFENVLEEEAKEETLVTNIAQETVQNMEEQQEETEKIVSSVQETEIPEEIAPSAQEELIASEEIAQEETISEEIAENNEISERETSEEIKEEEPEIVASVPIEEPSAEELPIEETAEIAQTEIVETSEETKSPEEIEEEIQQEIRQEIENENIEILDEIDETEEDILEVADIKEEIESAIGGTYNSQEDEEDVIEIQKEENISVHNLDVINRQAPSGNYDEEDLIELDEIKNEIAEIKNNLSTKETESQVEIIGLEQTEKVETIETVAQVEISKPQPKEISKVSITKPVPELKQAPLRQVKQVPEKLAPKSAPALQPVPPKKAPIKKAPVARILCKTQIENDRGLYLADYAGNKALVGYVNNNVFVLYNFKKTKIRNNEIIFRLSEAKPKEDLYYVMVDNKKFLIKSEQYRLSLMQKIS